MKKQVTSVLIICGLMALAIAAKSQYIAHPDTSVNSLKLMYWKSVLKKFDGDTSLINQMLQHTDESDFPYVDFLNDNETQLLQIYIHRGYHDLAFAEIRIKYAENYRHKNQALGITDKSFKTSNGLKLGMSKETVIARMGKPFRTYFRGEIEIVEYAIWDVNSTFLRRYNQPSYFAYYKFNKNQKLVQIHFGFNTH